MFCNFRLEKACSNSYWQRAGFRFPFLERKDELTLDLISVDVKTQEAVPTAECINISVDAVANIKIGTSEEALAKAAQHFLNKDACDINATARIEDIIKTAFVGIDCDILIVEKE